MVEYHNGARRSISIALRPRDAFVCSKLQSNPKGIVNREIMIQGKLPCLRRVPWFKYHLPRPEERQKPRQKDLCPERPAHDSIVLRLVFCNTNRITSSLGPTVISGGEYGQTVADA